MKRGIVGGVILGALLLFTAPGGADPLAAGAKAPDFLAKASLGGKGFKFLLRQALRQGPLVLYFYPSAFTKGCDLEAHAFADAKADFAAAGAQVLGVSADNLKRLNAFSSDPQYCAGAFPVASDPGGRIAARYGLVMMPGNATQTDVRGLAIGHGFIPRTTFVIGRDGRIAATLSSFADHLEPADHATRALAVVQRLAAAKTGEPAK